MTREEAISELDTAITEAMARLATCQDRMAADLIISLSDKPVPISYRILRLAQAERMLLDWSDIPGEDLEAAQNAQSTLNKQRWYSLVSEEYGVYREG